MPEQREHVSAAAERAFEELLSLYSEPIRYYHTTGHIGHCLRLHELASAQMSFPDAVEMSVWYHDAIYVPGAKDNELRSAELFESRAREWLPEEFRKHVFELIMATERHHPVQVADSDWLIDIDLSSFGASWDEFLIDSASVRRELSHLGDTEFFAAQRKFLSVLEARDPFCFTNFFRARHELQAKANLRRYLRDVSRTGKLPRP